MIKLQGKAPKRFSGIQDINEYSKYNNFVSI